MNVRFDMPRLERSLRRFAGEFGDTNAQAVIRWSIQVCRELAVESLPFGAKKMKETHVKAITADALRVTHIIKTATPRRTRSDRWLNTPEALNAWMDSNRGRNNRTRQLSDADKKECLYVTLKKAVAIRMKRAGIAKGGFIGAGQDIARAQTGMDRINIGRNFLSYAQKHAAFGDATKPRSGFNPSATLRNKASHTSKDYVLKKSAVDKAIGFGLRKTISWYRAAMRRVDRSNP